MNIQISQINVECDLRSKYEVRDNHRRVTLSPEVPPKYHVCCWVEGNKLTNSVGPVLGVGWGGYLEINM